MALSNARTRTFYSLRTFLPTLTLPAITVPLAIHLNIPSLLPRIFESILRAVPKKKQSHSRKRMRQLAGKALKDVTALNKCPGCGRMKRAHVLCEHCTQDIKNMWMGKESDGKLREREDVYRLQ